MDALYAFEDDDRIKSVLLSGDRAQLLNHDKFAG
jgi:hypothetical protein